MAALISAIFGLRPRVRLPARDRFTQDGRCRYWFHASSVGELESMVPLLGLAVAEGARVVVTYFSRSALLHAAKVEAELKAAYPQCEMEFVGFGPWEGSWRIWMERIQPSLFVTAKYESWPELWMALAELDIPLVVLAARARRSFYWADRVIRWAGGRLPRMDFIVSTKEDRDPLLRLFPHAGVHILDDPRWERVKSRLKVSNSRVKVLVDKFRNRSRPWGALAQAWLKDLEFFGELLKSAAPTVWIIPHDVEEKNIQLMERYLHSIGVSMTRTSRLHDALEEAPEEGVIFVDERGILVELYPYLDWAYVGGGFSKGIHSTIEPAIQAIPVSCASKNVDKFAEVAQLQAAGQLTVLRSRLELGKWLKDRALGCDEAMRRGWKSENDERVGATKRIFEVMRERTLS